MWIICVLAAAMVAAVAVAALKRKKSRSELAERRWKARMIRHANEEHSLVMQGKLSGVTGDYPTPPELRGVGFPWAQ